MSGLNSLGKDGFVDLNGMCLKDYFNKNVLSNLCPRFKKKMHSLCCIKMYVFCFACLFFFFFPEMMAVPWDVVQYLKL